MQALTFHGKQTIRYESVTDPTPTRPGDAIVRVTLCAICGSDLHPYHEREKGLDHGTVMGHEFVGEIVATGRDVTRLRIGDMVFSPFTTNCGRCYYCKAGLTCRCTHGQLFGWRQDKEGLHGAQAEYVRVPLAEATLLLVPEGVSQEEALLLGDILSTGYFCADMADIQPGNVCAVVGCGPVGLLAITAAREHGAETIFAIDAIPERLALAQSFGATPVNYRSQNPAEIIFSATDGRGADAILEVVGTPAAGRSAVELVRPGGTIATVGVHTEERMAFTPVEAYDKNLTYRSGRCPARHYMQTLIPLVQQKKYDFTAVISHRAYLSDGTEAYRMFDQKQDRCTKVLLTPEAK